MGDSGTVPIPFRCFKDFANFALTEFSEVRPNGVLRRSCRRRSSRVNRLRCGLSCLWGGCVMLPLRNSF